MINRRILLSKKGEFYYSNSTIIRSLALKKLAGFFDGVERKTKCSAKVMVSNKCINTDKTKRGG